MNKVVKIQTNSDYEMGLELTEWKEGSYQLTIKSSSKATGKWVDNKKDLFMDKKELQKICNYFNEVNDTL